MEKVMIFDEKAKSRIGIICCLPAIAFLITFVYYSILLWPLAFGHHQPGSAVGIISRNYNTLFLLLAIDATITAPIFIYCLVLLARVKHMTAESKLIWIILLSVSAPISSVFFWYFHVKKFDTYVPVYPDIA